MGYEAWQTLLSTSIPLPRSSPAASPCSETASLLKRGQLRNRTLVAGVALTLVLEVLPFVVPFAGDIVDLQPLHGHRLLVVTIAFARVLVFGLDNAGYRRRMSSMPAPVAAS